jgi:hypothetical protein
VYDTFGVRRLVTALVVAVCVLAAGTIGFRIVLDEDWGDALYRAVVTSSLAGVDSRPSGTAGEVLTMLLVLSGLAIFGYVAAVLVESITRGVVTGAWSERRRRRAIDRLEDHYIICGYGRVGRRVAEEFRQADAKYVVLDFNEEAIEAAREHGNHFICDGRSIGDLHIQGRTGALIIALRKADGTFDTTPSLEAVLEAGDVMISVGTHSELRALEALFATQQPVAG